MSPMLMRCAPAAALALVGALCLAPAPAGSASPAGGAAAGTPARADSASSGALEQGSVAGRVLARAGRRPLRLVKVSLVNGRVASYTDSAGVYRLEGVPAGGQAVRAETAGFIPVTRSVEVSPGRTAELDFELDAVKPRPSGRLGGRVTHDGGAAPLPRVYVSRVAVENATRADSAGVFLIPSVPPGWHPMRAVALGYDEVRFRALVEDGKTTLVTLDMGRSLAAPPAGAGGGERAAAASSPGGHVPVRALADSAGAPPQRAGHPSPGEIEIAFEVPPGPGPLQGDREVTLEILDADGRTVRRLVEWPLAPGAYLAGWDGADGGGSGVPAGFYTVRLTVEGALAGEFLTRTP